MEGLSSYFVTKSIVHYQTPNTSTTHSAQGLSPSLANARPHFSPWTDKARTAAGFTAKLAANDGNNEPQQRPPCARQDLPRPKKKEQRFLCFLPCARTGLHLSTTPRFPANPEKTQLNLDPLSPWHSAAASVFFLLCLCFLWQCFCFLFVVLFCLLFFVVAQKQDATSIVWGRNPKHRRPSVDPSPLAAPILR